MDGTSEEAQMKNFPRFVYVTREGEGKDAYLLVNEATGNIDENGVVGVYELTRTAQMVVTRELRDRTQK